MKLRLVLLALTVVAFGMVACKSGPYTYENGDQATAALKSVLLATPGLVDVAQCKEIIDNGLWQSWAINGGWEVTVDAIYMDKVDSPTSPQGYIYTVRPGYGHHFAWKFFRTTGVTQIEGQAACTLAGGQSYVYTSPGVRTR